MSVSQFKIRLIREDDWPEFQVIDAELFPDDLMSNESFSRAISRGAFFALESDTRLIGMLVVSKFGEGAGHLGRIGVSKSMQNKGFGTILMEYAMDWFRNENLTQAILYTQDHNKHAQHLYRKFGFEIIGTTWHYFVPFKTLTPTGEYRCEPIHDEEIDFVGRKYHDYLPAAQIGRFLESEDFLVFVLKNRDSDIVGACRYTPSFPGCMPFRIDNLDGVDDFIHGLEEHSLPKYDYIRLTFTDNEDLANLCHSRGYKLHHRLFRMMAEVPPKS
ncbi:MAG: GNAT family N-acetyltransferase [Candidatus Hermodarchaeota archaeon]